MSERSDKTTRSGSGRRGAARSAGDNRLVVIAVVLGVVAVILQMIYVQWVKSAAGTDEFTVYRFEVGLEKGEELQQDDLEAVPVPVRFRETFRGAIKSDQLENYLGSRLERPTQQSDLLTFELFQEPVGRTLALEVDPDKRLVPIPVQSDRLQGLLRPGDRVDLAAPIPVRGSTQPEVMPVMSDVRVMAVGRRSVIEEAEGVSDRMRSFTHIRIQVTPQQWLDLTRIENLATGPFFVAIRNPSRDGSSGLVEDDVLPPPGQIYQPLLELIESR